MITKLKNSPMSIEKVLFDLPGKMSIKLEDGRIIIIPLRYFPELQKLPLEKRKKHTIVDDRTIFFRTLNLFITWKISLDLRVNGGKDEIYRIRVENLMPIKSLSII